MDDLVMFNLINDLENEEEAEELAASLRRAGDPLQELPERQFIKLFRVSKELFNFMVTLVEPYMRPKRRPSDLSIHTRVLAALRFYAAGSYQADVGYNGFISISQQSVSNALHEVTDALNQQQMLNTYVKFPYTLDALRNVRQQFYNEYGVPGIVGCIDRTHIAIVPPAKNNPQLPEHIFVNRKGYHSLNCQFICDTNLKILNVVANYPGSTHDAFIWNNSQVQELLRQIHREEHRDFYLLGDSGYPLRPWLFNLVTPEPQGNTPECRYNKAIKCIRSLIERCNGLLKGRFRCCLKHRMLHYTPEVAARIINACVVLHNLCIDYNIPPPEGEKEINAVEGIMGGHGDPQKFAGPNPELEAGRSNRARLIRARFQNN